MKNTTNINTLPDDILCQIISFLPTKDACQTSMLSSGWRNLITFVPILKFKSPRPTSAFISTLNRLLNNSSQVNLQKLKLHLTDRNWKNNMPHINFWINSAINRNVVSLDISIPDYFSNETENQELALHITASDSLQNLKISGGLSFYMPCTPVSFKNLKTFKIKLNDPEKELLANLFCSLPQLEKLSLEIHFSEFMEDMNISINIILPAIKRLFFCIRQDEEDNVDSKILIDAPLLEYLSIREDYLATYVVNRPPAVVEASLAVCSKLEDLPEDEDRFYRVIKLLEGLSSAKSLSVIAGTSIAVDSIGSELPILHNVTYLELDDVCLSGLAMIPMFLERAPNLRKVVLKILEEIDDCEDFHWLPPEALPSSLQNLEEFEIIGGDMVNEVPYVMEMANYIYENAKLLKKFVIDGNIWIFLS